MRRQFAAFVLMVLFLPAALPQQTPPDAGRTYRQYAEGLLVREVYTTSDRVTVDIWDVMVGPGKTSASVTLPGSVVLEVRSGSGTLVQGDARQALRLGTVLSLPSEARFSLSNASRTQPLVLRAIIARPL
jgi:hypothetical protein